MTTSEVTESFYLGSSHPCGTGRKTALESGYVLYGVKGRSCSSNGANLWSSSEYNSTNAVNVNSGGNMNNNNKYNNSFGVVPAREIQMPPILRLAEQYTYIDVARAYLECRRRKRNKSRAIAFEIRFEHYLVDLLHEINSGTYTIGASQVFVVTRPKAREVWAANFRDRIVHHLIYRDIGPWYEARFIEDSYSCIKGRGTLAAAQRLSVFLQRATNGWTQKAWCLQIDIANFFVSIDKSIMWDILKSNIGESSMTSRLAKQVLFHDPTVRPYIGTPEKLHLVPKHKSLWHCPKGKGLPIGNLTSQFFSNVYLDELDKYVKHVLKVKGYVRYVDDAVLVATDRDQLKEWCVAINKWLMDYRGLHLHPDKVLMVPADRGINFVGHVVLPYRTYPRTTTVAAAKEAARQVHKRPFDTAALCSLNSYLGMMRHDASYTIRKHLCHTAAVPMILGHDSEMTKIIKL